MKLLRDNRLAKNFLSLGIVQVTNFLIPLIIAPHVIRTVGIERYGSMNVAMAVAIFFNVIIDYGFNLTATRDASLNRHDNEKLSHVISTVITCKLIIMLLVAIMFTGVVFVVPDFRDEMTLFFLSFSLVVGQALLPSWFFQGIEQMKYITYLTLVSKVIAVILILTLIREQTDYIYVNFITGISTVISSAIGIYMAFRIYRLTFKAPSFQEMAGEASRGFLILVSNVFLNIYSLSTLIVLNFVTRDKVLVGSYSVAEKVVVIVRQVLAIYIQVVYPHLCNLLKDGFAVIRKALLKTYIPFLGLIIGGTILLYVIAPYVVWFLSGTYDETTIYLLRLISPVPLIVTLNMPFTLTLLVYDFRKIYSTIYISAAFVCVGANLLLTWQYGATGTGISVIFGEVFVTIVTFFVCRRKYITKIRNYNQGPTV